MLAGGWGVTVLDPFLCWLKGGWPSGGVTYCGYKEPDKLSGWMSCPVDPDKLSLSPSPDLSRLQTVDSIAVA